MIEHNPIENEKTKNDINNLLNRKMISDESEYLFKYLLGAKKMKKINDLIKSLPKDSIDRDIHIKKLTKYYNKILRIGFKLINGKKPIKLVSILYAGHLGIDVEEEYWQNS